MSTEPTAPVACYASVSEFFATLASPVRAAIVHRLADHDHTVGELVEALGVSQPLVSQHLRHLRSANIVHATRMGRQVSYSLADEHVTHVFADAFKHTEEHHHDHR